MRTTRKYLMCPLNLLTRHLSRDSFKLETKDPTRQQQYCKLINEIKVKKYHLQNSC